jgi:uncharacterized membrane protein (UPF0127 family)
VKIFNKTKNTLISNDSGYTGSFWGRLRGLMLTRKKDLILACEKEGILESTIHMMNMLYSIDVVWADSSMRVVDYRRSVPPLSILKPTTWKTYAPGKAAKYIIELGTTKLEDISIGDVLSFERL